MTPYYQDKWVTILLGDSRELLLSLSGASAIVTDPPYELGFMGKSWDSKGISFQKETWEAIRKSCLLGAPLLSFGGTRTFHRIAVAIEDGGWEIRDTLMWVYGQGFPKSLDISKAIDKIGIGRHPEFARFIKEAREKKGYSIAKVAELGGFHGNINHGGAVTNWEKGYNLPTAEQYNKLCSILGLPFESIEEAEREIVGTGPYHNPKARQNWGSEGYKRNQIITAPATNAAQLWEGYGTALKPAYEPIILAMNPLDGTFANNALKHGVAGLNIDECRVGTEKPVAKNTPFNSWRNLEGREDRQSPQQTYNPNQGRFPSNFIHDGSQMVMELFPDSKSTGGRSGHTAAYSGGYKREYYGDMKPGFGDNGSAARFFYCAKASKGERDKGCEGLEEVVAKRTQDGGDDTRGRPIPRNHNNHPTVKPLALMEYLVKLVKMPEYNLVIDPFMGSGTTLLACIKLGLPCIGIDNDEKTCEIAARRCSQEVMELV